MTTAAAGLSFGVTADVEAHRRNTFSPDRGSNSLQWMWSAYGSASALASTSSSSSSAGPATGYAAWSAGAATIRTRWPLDDFEIQGDTLKFNILHEDWGPGTLPFHNQVVAHIGSNEMRIQTQQDNMPVQPARPGGGSSLMGPISIESTAGNK